MDIEIIEFTLRPTPNRMGYGVLRYFELYLRFDLCYYAKNKHFWVRMPEKWINSTTKVQYGYWLDKNTSDKFQILTIKKIFDKYELEEAKVIELHAQAKEKFKKNKIE